MKGSIWAVVVIFVGVGLIPAIFDFNTSAPGVQGDFASMLSPLTEILALCAFAAALFAFVGFVYGDSGGGF